MKIEQRKSIHGYKSKNLKMESDNRNSNGESFRNHKQTKGQRLESNEELSTTENETDNFDDFESEMKARAHNDRHNTSYDRTLKQKKSVLHTKASYNKELYRTKSETDDYDDSEKDRAHIKAEDDRHGQNYEWVKMYSKQAKMYSKRFKEKIYFLPNSNKERKFAFNFGQKGKSALKFAILTFLLSAITYWYFFKYINSESLSNGKRLKNEIANIRSEFRSQEDDIWYAFSSGIKDVEDNPAHPSVFLMLYDGGEDTPMCLAIKIAKAAMNFLNVTKPAPIILDGLELGKNKALKNDYGELIAEEKQRVEEYRTMIVKNIHKVPGKVAQAFHSFCDTYTPLVDKAVYLFTLHAAGASDAHHPTALAEQQLEQSWKKELNEDKLKPLITRITDNVVVVKSEALPNSCLNFI